MASRSSSTIATIRRDWKSWLTLSSAFNPPGYPLLLTPLAFLSRVTGWFSLPFAAALLVALLAGILSLLAGLYFTRRSIHPIERPGPRPVTALYSGNLGRKQAIDQLE